MGLNDIPETSDHDEDRSCGITTVEFEKVGGGIFRIRQMRQQLAIFTFLRYVG